MPPEELALVIKLRRVLHALEPGAALELLTDKIRATKSNEQFLKEIAKAPSAGQFAEYRDVARECRYPDASPEGDRTT